MIGFRYDKNEVILKKKSGMSFSLLDGMGLSSIRLPSLWLINGLASDQGFFGGRASRFWARWWWTGNDAFFFILDAVWAALRVAYTITIFADNQEILVRVTETDNDTLKKLKLQTQLSRFFMERSCVCVV